MKKNAKAKVYIVIPCFRVKEQILDVISRINLRKYHVVIVDDCCPEKSGLHARGAVSSKRVKVLFNGENLGVGGATKVGYEYAIENGAEIIVKLDGDGQMPPEQIDSLIEPIISCNADYVTGNRFQDIESIAAMPKTRVFGNAALSFIAKASTGYWKLFDPNNGFTAIKTNTLTRLPLEKIDNRYFFESDMLFRLGLLEARLVQVPMNAIYGNEKSSLSITKSIFEFSGKHLRNLLKRIVYSYFIRDFNTASVQLSFGLLLSLYSVFRGVQAWLESASTGIATSTGTQFLIAVTFLMGFQLLLSFVNLDITESKRNF